MREHHPKPQQSRPDGVNSTVNPDDMLGLEPVSPIDQCAGLSGQEAPRTSEEDGEAAEEEVEAEAS